MAKHIAGMIVCIISNCKTPIIAIKKGKFYEKRNIKVDVLVGVFNFFDVGVGFGFGIRSVFRRFCFDVCRICRGT